GSSDLRGSGAVRGPRASHGNTGRSARPRRTGCRRGGRTSRRGWTRSCPYAHGSQSASTAAFPVLSYQVPPVRIQNQAVCHRRAIYYLILYTNGGGWQGGFAKKRSFRRTGAKKGAFPARV